MKLTKALCRTAKIFNPHNYANGEVYITYHPEERGRISTYASWSVSKAGMKLSDFWRDYGSMHLTVHRREQKEAVLKTAMKYVTDKFGIVNFAKTPFGSWMDAEFVAKRNAEIVAILKGME